MEEMTMATKRTINSSNVIEYDIFGEICDHSQYNELREDLILASPDDTFILNINSGGGDVDVAMMLIKAMQSSNANVICRVVFPSASMASLIAISGDHLTMDPHTELMFHSYSCIDAYYPKSNELIETTMSMHKHLSGMFNDVIGKFLTNKEINNLWQGKDIRVQWDDEDLNNRIKRHFNKE